jgi:hypothetical protein
MRSVVPEGFVEFLLGLLVLSVWYDPEMSMPFVAAGATEGFVEATGVFAGTPC